MDLVGICWQAGPISYIIFNCIFSARICCHQQGGLQQGKWRRTSVLSAPSVSPCLQEPSKHRAIIWGMKGARAEPEQLPGVCDKPITSNLKCKSEPMRGTPHCLASAPSSSSCQEGHDDLKSEVFEAITVCFLGHLQWFYFCKVNLDCFSGPSSIPCDTALPIWGMRFSNQFIYF